MTDHLTPAEAAEALERVGVEYTIDGADPREGFDVVVDGVTYPPLSRHGDFDCCLAGGTCRPLGATSLPVPPIPKGSSPYPLRNALADMPTLDDAAVRTSIDEVQRRLREADAELYATLPTAPAGYHWWSELAFESDGGTVAADVLRNEVTVRITYRLRPDAGAVPQHE